MTAVGNGLRAIPMVPGLTITIFHDIVNKKPVGGVTIKEKLKLLFKWAVSFLLCVLVIYLSVFFGGWKLFESGDPVLIEIGAAFVLSIFVFSFNEVVTDLDKRVKMLEKRIQELEKKR